MLSLPRSNHSRCKCRSDTCQITRLVGPVGPGEEAGAGKTRATIPQRAGGAHPSLGSRLMHPIAGKHRPLLVAPQCYLAISAVHLFRRALDLKSPALFINPQLTRIPDSDSSSKAACEFYPAQLQATRFVNSLSVQPPRNCPS